MKKKTTFTQAQMAALAPYEAKYLRTWHDAKWCRPLPAPLVDLMLSLWEAVTGSRRPFRSGCPTCERELMADVTKIYYNTLEALKETPVGIAPDTVAQKPAQADEAPKPKKAPSAKKKTAKAKK